MTATNPSTRNLFSLLLTSLITEGPTGLPNATVNVDNEHLDWPALVELFTETRSAMTENDTLTSEAHKARVVERPLVKKSRAAAKHLRSIAVANLGVADPMFKKLGFTAKTRAPQSSQAKADAKVKSAETRKARGTKGSKQKKAIKGAPAPTPPKS
jgi:hypothetical protein